MNGSSTPRRTARARAAALALLALASACLLPQSVEPDSSRTHQPPRVRLDSVPKYLLSTSSTLQHGQADVAAGCSCSLELSVGIIDDDDPLATLEVRWFIDYDLARPNSYRLAVPATFIVGSFDSTLTERPFPTPLQISRDAFGLSDGFHAVDLVIAEQGGFDEASTTLPNRAVLPGYESTGYRFFIEVVTADNSSCPNSLPSVRTCSGDGGI